MQARPETTSEQKLQDALTLIKNTEASQESADFLKALKNLESVLADHNVQAILAGNENIRLQFQNTYAICVNYVTNELTDVSRRLFINLTHLDNLENDDPRLQPVSHQEIMKAYESLQAMVINEIVKTENIDERTIVMERWIEIMNRTFVSGDFFTSKAIFLALAVSVALNKLLKATKAGLSAHANKVFEVISQNFSGPAMTLKAMKNRKPDTYIPSYIEHRAKFINLQENLKASAKPYIEEGVTALQQAIIAQIKLDTAKTIPSTPIHRAVLQGPARNEPESEKFAALREPKDVQIEPCSLFKTSGCSSIIISAASIDALQKSNSEETSRIENKKRETTEKMIKALSEKIKQILEREKADVYKQKLIKLTSKLIKDDDLSKRCRKVINDIIEHMDAVSKDPANIKKLIDYLEAAVKDEKLKQQSGIGSFLNKVKVSDPKIIRYIKQLLVIYKNDALNGNVEKLIKCRSDLLPGLSPASSQSQLNLFNSPSSINLSRAAAGSFISPSGSFITPSGSFILPSGSSTPSAYSTPVDSRSPTPTLTSPSSSTIRRKSVMVSSTYSIIPSSSSKLNGVFVPPLQVPASPSSPAAKTIDSQEVNSPVTASESASKAEVKTPKSADRHHHRHHHRRHSAQLTEAQIVSANIELSASKDKDHKSKRNTMSEQDLKSLMGHSSHSRHSRRKSLDLSSLQAVTKDTAEGTSSARDTAEKTVKKDMATGSVSARSTSDSKQVKRRSSIISSLILSKDQPGEERRFAPPAPSATAQPSSRLQRERSKSNVAEVKKATDGKPVTGKDADVTDIEAKVIAAKDASKSFADKFKEFETAIEKSRSVTTATLAAPGGSHRGTESGLRSSTGVEGTPAAVNSTHSPRTPSRPASHSTGARQTSDRNLSVTSGIVKTNSSSVVQHPTNSARMLSRPASHSTGARQDSERSLRTSGGAILKVSSGNVDQRYTNSPRTSARPVAHSGNSRQTSERDLKTNGGSVDQKYTNSPRTSARPVAHSVDSRQISERDLKPSSGDNSSKQANNSPRSLISPTRIEKRENNFRELQGLFAAHAQTPANSPRITVTPASQRSTSLRDVHTLDKKFTPPPAPLSSRDINRLSLRAPLDRTDRAHSVGNLRRYSVIASANVTANATIRPLQKDNTVTVASDDKAKQAEKMKNGV